MRSGKSTPYRRSKNEYFLEVVEHVVIINGRFAAGNGVRYAVKELC